MTFPDLPRVTAFEFNDQPWVPEALRDVVVESLGRTLRWGRILDGVVEPFADFLAQHQITEVLDLGSGSGEPAAILASALRGRGHPVPRFLLTDLFPRPAAWRALRAKEPAIDFVEEPVDATAIPEAIGRGRARTVINVLHHFPPPLAESLVADAVGAAAPLFVVEGFERNPLGFIPFAPTGLPALALAPILTRRHRLAKALLVWASPIGLAVSLWDGFVSTLRVYREDELRGMVARAGGEAPAWAFGRYRFPFGGRGTFFHSPARNPPA